MSLCISFKSGQLIFDLKAHVAVALPYALHLERGKEWWFIAEPNQCVRTADFSQKQEIVPYNCKRDNIETVM